MKYSIPDKRDLKKSEKEILSYLFHKEKPEWINLIQDLKVVARCGCGKCPTILFGKTINSKIQDGSLLIDYKGKSENFEKIGVSLVGTKIMPTQLEFYSIDGKSEISKIPNTKTLKPFI